MLRILQTLSLCLVIGIAQCQTVTKTNPQQNSTTTSAISCSDWLYLPSQPAAVEIGQLNVTGNIITVEALINRTTAYTGGAVFAGDVVSKHSSPSDANYLLRPNEAEITTSNGYFATPPVCEIQLNKTYHIAMTYDGATLKFYRNGYLMSQVAASGDLYQNTWPTRIGLFFAGTIPENFIGYINEVRIWNVVRTQAQIQAYMNTSLPNPTTQTGLLAYYQFSDLTNKQGNPVWNGTLVGTAVSNQSNPTCASFNIDSCCSPLQGTLIGDSICNGGNATLTFNGTNGIPPYTLTYTDGINTYTQNNVQNNVPFALPNRPTSNTTYGLISIQDASTCGATNVEAQSPSGLIPVITAKVLVYPLPQGTLKGEDICIGNMGNLLFSSTVGTPPFSISYSNGLNTYQLQNLSADTSFIVPYQIFDTTVFTLLSVTDSNGCIENGNTSTSINVIPLPQGGISNTKSVCAGDSAELVFTSSFGTAPFLLTIGNGTNNTTYSNIQSGVPFFIGPLMTSSVLQLIAVTDKNGKGCTRNNNFNSGSAQITVYPSPQLQFDSIGNTCLKSPPFLITEAKEISGIGGSGRYSGRGVDASGNFTPSLAGAGKDYITYTFTATDGCTDSLSREIIVNANPIANAGPDLIACKNISVQLLATGGITYTWTPAEGLNNPDIANPKATITNTTTYTVNVTDSNGCSSSDSVVVNVSPVGKAIYVLPNAFTPNGDGVNDCFGVKRWDNVTIEQFSIYNRWGQLVFTTKNPSDCWDGTIKGIKQDSGTFVYFIKAQTPCGEVSLKGTVTLIR